MCIDWNRQELFQDQCPVHQLTYSYQNFTSDYNSSVSICYKKKNTHTFRIACEPVETTKKEPRFFNYICSAHVSEIMKAKIQRSFLCLALSVCAGVCGWCFTQMRTQL